MANRWGPSFCRPASAFLLMFLLVTHPTRDATARNKTAAGANEAASLVQLVESRFPHWDSNSDGLLDVGEINRQIASPSIHGTEAAILVAIFRGPLQKGDRSSVTRQEILAVARDRGFQKGVEKSSAKLATLERDLLLPDDPNLLSFHQGRIGDCYLLAGIAAAVHRNPQTIRDMIHPAKAGGFDVAFGDGRKVHVSPVTDAELLLGARMDDTHGIWLAVLEKAWGIIRERKKTNTTGVRLDPKEAVPEETIGGGRSGTITSLLTGHEVERVNNPGGANRKGPLLSIQELHETPRATDAPAALDLLWGAKGQQTTTRHRRPSRLRNSWL